MQDSASIVFVGAGKRARSHLDAFLDLFPLRDIWVFGRGEANGLALCKKAEALGLTARDHTVPRQPVEGADIVVADSSAENLDWTPLRLPIYDSMTLERVA